MTADQIALLAEVRAKLEGITPGEWDCLGSVPGSSGNWNEEPSAYEPATVFVVEDQPICYMNGGAYGEAVADTNADFIAFAPRLLRALLGVVESQQRDLDLCADGECPAVKDLKRELAGALEQVESQQQELERLRGE